MIFKIRGKQVKVNGLSYRNEHEARLLILELLVFLFSRTSIQPIIHIDNLLMECQLRVDNSFNDFRFRFYEIAMKLENMESADEDPLDNPPPKKAT